jgi:hypothetical protein
MPEAKQPSELTLLRNEYKEALGKNPSPKLDAAALRAAIDAAKAPPADPPADEPEAQQPEAEQPEAPAAEKPKASSKKAAKAAEAPEAPKGTALLDHDDPDASANHAGIEIVRGANGLYLVPLGFVEHLVAHGFRVVGAPAEEA